MRLLRPLNRRLFLSFTFALALLALLTAPSMAAAADQGIAQQKGLRGPGVVFLADICQPAEEICRWYEERSGDYCDYVWCMQYHIRLGLIPFSCLAGEIELSDSFC